MHPQTFSAINGCCIQELVRQFLCCIAIINSFEVHYPTVLLRTRRGDGQCALARGIKNDELSTNFATLHKVRRERQEKVTTNTVRFTDAANLEETVGLFRHEDESGDCRFRHQRSRRRHRHRHLQQQREQRCGCFVQCDHDDR